MAYKIYTKRNLADTSRDPDEYVYEQLGYKHKLDDAITLAEDHIQKKFFRPDTMLRPGEGNIVYTALDVCSYGARIIIEEITID